ncbi:ligase-associated DNA damage response DEXH box helicase [Flavobacterium sp.]|jgi:ATP-dependent Lhr-like helicase|uniref:ligase-associated DNA damage response DEXH box helicase n=1 Tax=Flavobacterium sp. TaxID=239 RepID=UPI0037BEDB9D
MNQKELITIGKSFFKRQGWTAFAFQLETWNAFLQGKNGLLHAPTGSGKTFALWIPIALHLIRKNKNFKEKLPPGVKAIWITPLRALSVEIKQAAEKMVLDLDLPLTVGIRTGDTSASERVKQKTKMPDLLVTTPESLQLLLATKGYDKIFKNCEAIVIDEWHELLGTKRGVQMELALSRLKTIVPKLQLWGISATIGNLAKAQEVLFGVNQNPEETVLVSAQIHKKIRVESVLPEKMETYPYRGHMGLHLLDQVAEIIKSSKTTLIFTNVRSACELWFQRLLEKYPEFAGEMAMHRGSISRETRHWVENAIRNEELKVVVCTSSLDLGVDFAPVESIVQVGSPKGVARFLQRAGRSGHQPGKESRVYFLATYAMELIEASALRKAVENGIVEDRVPFLNSWDVLIQYLNTLAVSDGFYPNEIFKEVKSTFCYQEMTPEEWQWIINFLVYGSQSLQAYDEFKKVELDPDGCMIIRSRRTAMHHRMSIGTIVSDASMMVKFLSGGYIGSIEESFASRLQPGDTFIFGGKKLTLFKIKNMQVLVQKAAANASSKVVSWSGGRMSFSAQMSELLRQEIHVANKPEQLSVELEALEPIFKRQRKESIIPNANEFLIETFKTREGYHAIFYPFEGRFVHEALASVLAYRMSLLLPISFSLAYNDYGFELLSDQEFSIQDLLDNNLLSTAHLHSDLQASLNATEMARRKFRDIAIIAGLIFTGMPGKAVKAKHLQSGTQLLFEVFKEYEPNNLLLQQAYRETFEHQLEEGRLLLALERIALQEIVVKQCSKPTPFSFPIITDRLREKLSSESLAERIKKMTASYLK